MAEIPFGEEHDLICQQPTPELISPRHNLPRWDPPVIQQ